MRFAYIDSNGNEVPIPSVDALALRIELGAITENTELYDAQQDQWGPAHTHEIFHSLSRDVDGGEGFVAPAPPVALPPEGADASDEAEAAEDEVGPEEPTAEPTAEESDADADASDLGLTLAAALPESEGEQSRTDDDEDLTLDAWPGAGDDSEPDFAEGDLGDSAPTDASEAPTEEQNTDDGGFDFGDLGGGLELEGASAGGAGLGESAMDLSGDDSSAGFEGDMGLEPEMEFSSSGVGDFDGGGSLDLEQPMSDFSPADPPAWMDQEGPAPGGESVMDFSAASADSDTVSLEDVPLRERRTPRNKPSAPKLRRQSALAGPLLGVLLVVAIGVGGYLGWPLMSGWLARNDVPPEPSVVMPDIPPEMLPQMHSIAGAALADAFADVRRDWSRTSPPTDPGGDWLAGIYLANASRYSSAEDFWTAAERFLAGVRAIDGAVFHEKYAAQLRAQAVATVNADLMLERADSGFVAGVAARSETYALVDDVIAAALMLHDFLIANEDNIDYAPASAGTADPVLEATFSGTGVQEATEDRIAAVTDALDALGYLDVVTTDGLWGAVLSRIQEVGFR